MSQKEIVGTSEMKPPPSSPSGMPPRPSGSGVLTRAPWSMSHVLHGQPMMNMRPFYHMIHLPSPLAIVNTPQMFMPPRPSIQHHGAEGSVGACAVSGCPARPTPPACRACEESAEATKTTASCSASGPVTNDDSFLKFQKNAQLHGIKITSTKEKLGQCELSASGGRLNVASPEFTPHGIIQGSGKTVALPDSHLPDSHLPDSHLPDSYLPDSHLPDSHLPDSHLPDVIVVGSDTDDEDDLNREDAINCSKDDEILELQTVEVPLTVNIADMCADYSESLLSSQLPEVEGQESPLASDMQHQNSDEDVFTIGAVCSVHREMVSAFTQTEFTIVEKVNPVMIDECTSTEDLQVPCSQEASTGLAAAASVAEMDHLKQSPDENEVHEISVNVSEIVPSLEMIYDSEEEEMESPTEGTFPEATFKNKTNSLALEEHLLFFEQERFDNLRLQVSDVSDKKQRQNIGEISNTNSSTSNTSSSNVHEEESNHLAVCEQNGVSGDLERLERVEKCKKTDGIESSASSVAIRKDYHDGISLQSSDFRDECRRRNIAAVEAVCDMFEADKVAGDADKAEDSVTKVDNYLNTLNIKCPEVALSRGSDDYSRRLETMPVTARHDNQGLDEDVSSSATLVKTQNSEEINDLSNVLSRSRHSLDNCAVVDYVRRQPTGSSSIHSDDSSRKHQNYDSSSRNVRLDNATGASIKETICTSKIASRKGKDNVSRSEDGTHRKAYNTHQENLDVNASSISLLENDCSRNVMTSADEESLSGSENVSVAMSVSGAELKSNCSSMAHSLSQIGLTEPRTELMDMIKSQLVMCDSELATNPQMLETLAVQQLYLMHHEQMVFNQMMEAMRQQPQQLLLMQQQAAQQVLTPQHLLLQQHLVTQQQLAQSQLLPAPPFGMLPQTSKPQNTLPPPHLASRFPLQNLSCPEVLPTVHSPIPESSHLATCTNNNALRMSGFAGISELQNQSSQNYDITQSLVELRTDKNQESVIKAMDYKEQKSVNSVSKCCVDTKNSTLIASDGNGLSTVASPERWGGKRASSVSSATSASFHRNGECRESTVASPAMSSRSSAFTQQPDLSSSVSRSGTGKLSGLSDCKATDVYGDNKSFFNSSGVNTRSTSAVPGSSAVKTSCSSAFAPEKIGLPIPEKVDSKVPGTKSMSAVPGSSAVKTSCSSAFAPEKIGLPVSETVDSKVPDLSFSARGQGSSGGGGGGVRPKSVTKIDSIGNGGASADVCPRNFRSQEQSRDFVKFNKGEYGKEKLPEMKRSTGGSFAQGSASDQSAMGGDNVKNRRGALVPEKSMVHNRRTDGPMRRTSTHMQESDEDWGQAGSVAWIKDPLHYGPPKCSATRVRPKTEEW